MADEFDLIIGRRVRVRRKQLGMSQTALAKRLGIAFQQVQKYEKGSNRIASGRLFRISVILEVPVTYFFEDLPAVADIIDDQSTPKAFVVADNLSEIDAEKILNAFAGIDDSDKRHALLELSKSMRTSD